MSIGIIGAGAIGQALAKRIATAGLTANISNSRGPRSLVGVIEQLGSGITATSVDDASQADVVFLAVDWARLQSAVSTVRDWGGGIVVDATNPIVPPDFSVADLAGRGSSEVVAGMLPGAHVVKAFNTLLVAVLRDDPAAHGGRRVVFFAGDHADSKTRVAGLIEKLGFAGVDLGSLSAGGRLQQFPGGPLTGLNLIKL